MPAEAMTRCRDPTSIAPLLEVSDLKVTFPSEDGRVSACAESALSVARGEVLALVSGCSGRSVTSTAVMGLLDRSAEVTGSVRLHGTELGGRQLHVPHPRLPGRHGLPGPLPSLLHETARVRRRPVDKVRILARHG